VLNRIGYVGTQQTDVAEMLLLYLFVGLADAHHLSVDTHEVRVGESHCATDQKAPFSATQIDLEWF